MDIYVIGTGMVGYRQLTQEAIGALEASERAYLVHFKRTVKEYIGEFVDEVVPLTDEYEEGRDRGHAYARMAERVMDGAETAGSPVTFALYGHPMVFVSPTRWIVDEAPDRDLTVEVKPGISSMDCLYADLALDPGEQGIQMFEATDLLVREFELDPEVPAMIWQVGVIESILHSTRDSVPGRFSRFRDYLERFYPSDHVVKLVRTATYPIADPEIIEFEIGEFGSVADEVNAVQTLYIPPVRERPVRNEDLYERVQSREHLELVTE